MWQVVTSGKLVPACTRHSVCNKCKVNSRDGSHSERVDVQSWGQGEGSRGLV